MKNSKPNIILINCDDLGYGDIGCFGSKINATPYIDQMADEGLKLTDFYMASPVCSPSRAAMLTGSYPQRVGIPNVLRPVSEIGLDPKEETISSMLKKGGYSTKLIGKWHLGDQQEFLPSKHGFDEYFGIPYSNDMGKMIPNPNSDPQRKNFPPLPLMRDNDVIQEQPAQEGITERYTEDAVTFIRNNQTNPFFLYFAHMHVHRPILVSRRFTKTAKNGRYGAAVEAIDWSVGVILHELRNLGIDQNTIVIFTSDNGSNANLGGSNDPLRGTKGTTWEGGMRLPLIIRWPEKIKPGTISNSVATSMDLLPTLAAITENSLQENNIIDGENIESILFQPENNFHHKPFFYYLHNTLCAVRSGQWKLHVVRSKRTKNRTGGTGGFGTKAVLKSTNVLELYDLSKDPHEDHNVASDNPEIVKELSSYLEDCRKDLGDESKQIQGSKRRLPGKVNNPVPLTTFNPSTPVMWAEYDIDEYG